MATIVAKGESVYECDVCNRKIRVPTVKHGIDVIQRCVITSKCQGKLRRLTLAKDINSTPAFPPEVEGVQDWFQRRVLYTHTQPVYASVWTVHHNLGNKPTIHVYVNRTVNGVTTLVLVQPITVVTLDLNTTELTFEMPESGLVQLVALSSQNTTNPEVTTVAAISNTPVQITSNNGELTIATLASASSISVSLSYIGVAQDNVIIDYINVVSIPSAKSPWVGTTHALINGRMYTIRSLNLMLSPLAPAYFAKKQVSSGTAFMFSAVAGIAPVPGQALILLGRAPYESVDRVYDQYVDVASINAVTPETYYAAGKGYAFPSIVKTTYPLILVV